MNAPDTKPGRAEAALGQSKVPCLQVSLPDLQKISNLNRIELPGLFYFCFVDIQTGLFFFFFFFKLRMSKAWGKLLGVLKT